jgi:hypothetical protein
MFDVETCKRVVNICKPYWEKINDRNRRI